MASADVTQLLLDWRAGDRSALDRLMPIVYDDLRRVARRRLAAERSDPTWQPTVLVNECFLHLIDQSQVSWQDRRHFFAIAARTMRRILIMAARRHNAQKRGGGVLNVPLELARDSPIPVRDVGALEEALLELEKLSPRQCRVVELRVFAGLSNADVAEVLEVSVGTVKRDWLMAKAWLFQALHAR